MNLWWNYPISKAIRFMEHTRYRFWGCVFQIGPVAFCVVWRKEVAKKEDAGDGMDN